MFPYKFYFEFFSYLGACQDLSALKSALCAQRMLTDGEEKSSRGTSRERLHTEDCFVRLLSDRNKVLPSEGNIFFIMFRKNVDIFCCFDGCQSLVVQNLLVVRFFTPFILWKMTS